MYARVSTLSNYYILSLNKIEFYIGILKKRTNTQTHTAQVVAQRMHPNIIFVKKKVIRKRIVVMYYYDNNFWIQICVYESGFL